MNAERKPESRDIPTNFEEGGTSDGSGNEKPNATAEPTLSAEQCAELAGVSLDTIEKYAAIGLLTPIATIEGEARYRQSDIRSLFYTRKSMRPQIDADLPSSADLAEDSEEDDVRPPHPLRAELPSQEDASVAPAGLSGGQAQSTAHYVNPAHQAATTESATESSTGAALSKEEHQRHEEPTAAEHRTLAAENEAGFSPDEKLQPDFSVQEASGQSDTFKESIEAAQQEARDEDSNSRAVHHALREQIEVLKQERDWLRTRVEQLELRGEREQMLLLSESETIRRLVSQRSFTDRVLQTLRLSWVQSDRK